MAPRKACCLGYKTILSVGLFGNAGVGFSVPFWVYWTSPEKVAI